MFEKPLDSVRRIIVTKHEQHKAKSEAAREFISDTDTEKQRAIKEYVAEHPEATQAEVAEEADVSREYVKKLESTISDTSVGNGTQISRAKANDIGIVNQRKLDKLEQDHPDLFAQVQAGELTIYAATKQAGMIKPKFSMPQDPVEAGQYLAERVDLEWLQMFNEAFLDKRVQEHDEEFAAYTCML